MIYAFAMEWQGKFWQMGFGRRSSNCKMDGRMDCVGWIGDWFGGMGYVCMMVNEIEI